MAAPSVTGSRAHASESPRAEIEGREARVSSSEAQSRTPRFSIVVATYNVAPYLGEFIDSIEGQTFPLDRLQVIAVDDGSTDDSGAILEAWQRRRPELVTVVSKPNGGLPSARNAGLPHVRGEWVTFTDPDDILDDRYLAEVDEFLSKRPEPSWPRRPGAVQRATRERSRHPLRRHFVAGVNRLRNLNIDTGHFHGHAASTFFRTDEIRRANLQFDERLRVTFEDGHFCCVYLLNVPQPTVAYLPDAVYHYRKRGDGTSQLDRSGPTPAGSPTSSSTAISRCSVRVPSGTAAHPAGCRAWSVRAYRGTSE